MPNYNVEFREDVYDGMDEFEYTNFLEETVEAENTKAAGNLALLNRERFRSENGSNKYCSFSYNIINIKEEVTIPGPEVYDESGYQIG